MVLEVRQRYFLALFNSKPIILTTELIETEPTFVAISDIILEFIIVIGVLIILFYSIRRKFNSIDNHTNKKYSQNNNTHHNKNISTYKDDMKSYKKDATDLGVYTLPDGQTIVNITGKIIEFIKRK